jgi:hypothetical protein
VNAPNLCWQEPHLLPQPLSDKKGRPVAEGDRFLHDHERCVGGVVGPSALPTGRPNFHRSVAPTPWSWRSRLAERMNIFKRIAQRAKTIRTAVDAGMTTAEYAVGTVAACAFAALLYKVITSTEVLNLLTGVVSRALHVPF